MTDQRVFEHILREYGKKRLKSESDLRARRARIDSELPELALIEADIASAAVSEAIARVEGSPHQSCKERIATLRKEKAELLSKAGYSEEDLLPRYECPLCRDTGYVDDALCSCFKKQLVESLYDQSNIKDILKEENFNNFSFKYYPEGKPLSIAHLAVDTANSFIENFDSSTDNLLISGATGVGKSFLTHCIAKELLDEGNLVVYLSAIRLFDILSDATFGAGKAGPGAASGEYVRRYIYDCDLLIIDDLGTEMVNTFTSTQLFNIINERILLKKHTIISTNLSLQEIQERYSERVVSRLTNSYKFIKLLGDDIRMKKRLED